MGNFENPLLIETDSFVENTFEIGTRDGEFYIDVENPWAGDTETGFGYTCHATLTREQATGLRDWLTKALGAA